MQNVEQKKMTTPLPPGPRVAFYVLPDGTTVTIPRAPIDNAGIAIPGLVTRPDGRKIMVFPMVQEDVA